MMVVVVVMVVVVKSVRICNNTSSSSSAVGCARWCLDILKFLQVLFARGVELGLGGLGKYNR